MYLFMIAVFSRHFYVPDIKEISFLSKKSGILVFITALMFLEIL